MGNGHHRVAIDVVVVPIIGPGICVSGVWVGASPCEADVFVPSSDNIDLSELVSPPTDATCALPVIATV